MIIIPKPYEPPAPPDLTDGWQSVATIPHDRVIEVDALPHSAKQGHMRVKWRVNEFGHGYWAWEPRRGGLMISIMPTRWREVEK